MSRARLSALAVLVFALGFAVQAGEYSTADWWALRSRARMERARLDSLRLVVDSLEKVAKALETDPVTQERVARERFGMLRRGEFLYRLVPAGDSAGSARSRAGATPPDTGR